MVNSLFPSANLIKNLGSAIKHLAHAHRFRAPVGAILSGIGMRDVADVAVGDSIAINGCCLTIAEINGSTLAFDVSAESLSCTWGR